MTLVDAQSMVRGFFGALGVSSAGLTPKGLGSGAVDATPIAFTFEAEVLRCLAVVFRFREPLTPKLLEQLMEYDKAHGLSDASGKLVYDAESLLLAVERTYTKPVTAKVLGPELLELVRRAVRWSSEGIFEALR